ncbi:MAG: sodium-dependent transporter, partial [Bacteroidota bacterium]
SNIIMPVCGILMAVIAGWLLPSSVTRSELDIDNPYLFTAWQWLVRLAAPVILVMIMVSQMGV